MVLPLFSNSAIFSAPDKRMLLEPVDASSSSASVSRRAIPFPPLTPARGVPVPSPRDHSRRATASVGASLPLLGTRAPASGNTTELWPWAQRNFRTPNRHTGARRAKWRGRYTTCRPPRRSESPHPRAASAGYSAASSDTTSAYSCLRRHTSRCTRPRSWPPAARTSVRSPPASLYRRGPRQHRAAARQSPCLRRRRSPARWRPRPADAKCRARPTSCVPGYDAPERQTAGHGRSEWKAETAYEWEEQAELAYEGRTRSRLPTRIAKNQSARLVIGKALIPLQPVMRGAIVARLAAQPLPTLPGDNRHHDQRGHWIGPPPSQCPLQ